MKFLLWACLFFLISRPAFAAAGAWDVRAGNDLYRQGKYPQAFERYQKAAEKNPSEVKIEYDLGAAAYKSGDFEAAVGHFQKSLLTDDDELKPDVHFNLGNAFYHAGVTHEDKDVDQAIRLLEGSLESFDKALTLDAKDAQAADNREFVRRALERLKKKKEQRQQRKDRKNDQNNGQGKEGASSQDQASEKDVQPQEQPSGNGQKDRPKDGASDVPEDGARADTEEGSQARPEAQPGPQDPQNSSVSGQNDRAQISSQEEANAMVDDLERNDLPKGLLNFTRREHQPRPVDKDW